ncbi:MAG: ABC transporter substrate-binding protein [Candidatus Atribacteria bacterium]|nr:ABC transporter substrate-binding protein [Candidatus Atribacteria bacterium]
MKSCLFKELFGKKILHTCSFKILIAVIFISFSFVSVAFAESVIIKFLPGAWSGNTIDFIKQQVEKWEAQTGNKVEFLSAPNNSSEVLALSQQYLAAESSDVDIYPMDVVWPGMLGRYFIDLLEYFSQDEIAEYDQAAISANTVDGLLVGIPFYADVGIFYYRTDLLEKYGFDGPPSTWEEMRLMANKIQDGEREEGNTSFWGYVFDGAAQEGFTCDILEWVSSFGGGTFVDSNGNITINNPEAVAAFEEASTWIDNIVPPGVTSYKIEDARGVWQAGNSAFMRNWPFAFALGQQDGSPIKDKFYVGPLPHGPKGESFSALGGWQLAISRFSKNPSIAASLIKFLNTPENQKERMMELARTPTRPALFNDPEILEAYPWTKMLIQIKPVPRPSAYTGTKYNQVSTAIWPIAHDIITRKISAQEGVEKLEQELMRIKGSGW